MVIPTACYVGVCITSFYWTAKENLGYQQISEPNGRGWEKAEEVLE